MNCDEARESMSAFYDGELSPDGEGAMSQHLHRCESCAEEFAGFKNLSGAAKELPIPEPPAKLWPEIERALDSRKPSGQVEKERQRRPGRFAATLVAVAATVLVVVGVSWTVYQKSHDRERREELAVDMAQYADTFRKDPKEAQEYLLSKYESRFADVDEATRQLGYRPAVADALPERYAADAMYVMDMPCCKCVQCLCKSDDGRMYAIFEHTEDQPMRFGDSPAIDARCGGKACRVVQVNGQLAVSWKHGRRYITVVGPESLEEVKKVVESFGPSDKSR